MLDEMSDLFLAFVKELVEKFHVVLEDTHNLPDFVFLTTEGACVHVFVIVICVRTDAQTSSSNDR